MFCEAVTRSRRLWRKFQHSNDGQIAVIFALALMPIMIGVGAAVDYSRGNQVRTGMQAALDSAVLAAAINGTSNWQTVALNTFNGNLNSKGSTVAAPSFSLANGIYYGSAPASVPTAFLGVIGVKQIPVKASSAATTSKAPICLLALNAFDKGAFDMNGNPVLNAPTCAVQANTKDNRGMTQEGKPTATAMKFAVSGGHTGDGYSSTPQNGADTVSDPYAKIPFPSYDNCGNVTNGANNTGLTINGGTTSLWPGTYCGGITIKGQARVFLNPGIYVMVGGPLLLDGGSTLTGKEVMIAFTGADSTLRLWGNSTLDLTSPVSGTYANFQFFQNPNDVNGRGAWVSIGGDGNTGDASKATWDGIAYFPTQNFWVYGNTVVNSNSPTMSIVAGQIWLQGNSKLNVTNNNTRNLSVTQTMMSGGARLVQ